MNRYNRYQASRVVFHCSLLCHSCLNRRLHSLTKQRLKQLYAKFLRKISMYFVVNRYMYFMRAKSCFQTQTTALAWLKTAGLFAYVSDLKSHRVPTMLLDSDLSSVSFNQNIYSSYVLCTDSSLLQGSFPILLHRCKLHMHTLS